MSREALPMPLVRALVATRKMDLVIGQAVELKGEDGRLESVLIEAADGEARWSTVGCATNIIEASWQALADSLELPLLRKQAERLALVQ